MPRIWKLFLAAMRWSRAAVCETSAGRGLYDDFHDWPDSDLGWPAHMAEHRCRRCGKPFII